MVRGRDDQFLPTTPDFLIAVICFAILLTGLYIGTHGNLLLCIIMYWMINAAQQVGKNMFPTITAEGPYYKTVELIVLIIITVMVIASVIRTSLNAQHVVGPPHSP